MGKKLRGRVALVTGASSGIGEATALALAEEGARIAIAARRVDRLTTLAERIRGLGAEVLVLEADVSNESDARSIVEKTHAAWGRFDILINNAGVMLLSPIAEANTADWRRMVDVNLMGVLYTSRAALPIMIRQQDGHIVNVSSTAGRSASPNSSVYAATKFGIGAFAESLRRETYKDKVRITLVEPGIVETELRDHIPHAATKMALKGLVDSIRQLRSEDVAAAIVYAVTQPPHVNVNEILLRPTDQER